MGHRIGTQPGGAWYASSWPGDSTAAPLPPGRVAALAFTGTILQDFSARVTQAIDTGDLFSRDDFCLYWVPRDYDEIAWKDQVEIYNWCIEESKRLECDTVNRRANGESEGD